MDSSPSHLQEISGIRQQNANKQRKLRSDVWRHFEKSKGNDGKDCAKCNLCSKVFDGSSRSGTTRLWNHFNSCQRKTGGGRSGVSPNSIKVAGLLVVYNQEKEKLRQYFEKLSCRFSLTINQVGYGKNQVGYGDISICLMVHFIDDDWNLKELIIGLKRIEDNQDFKKYLKDVLLEWGIHDNISSIVKIPDNDRYVISCNERENWFSSQGSLPFNNKLLCFDSIDYIAELSDELSDVARLYLYNRIDAIVTKISSEKENFQMAKEKAKFLGKEVSDDPIPTKQDFWRWTREALVKFAMGLKEAFFELENMDSEFKSINLTKEEWDLHECYQDYTIFDSDRSWYTHNIANMHFPNICNLYMISLVMAKYEVLSGDGTTKRDVDNYWSEYNFVLAIAAVLDP